MLVLVAGFALTAVLLVRLGFRRGVGRADLGSMSPQWIATWRASQHASTM
jgi:hypothetical protein